MTVSETKIEWTDFTVNFWEGCQKVGPGCDNCYAEARDIRFTGGSHWGPGAPRRKVKVGVAKLQKINRDADAFHAEHGRWPRVFCSSLSDIFDNSVDPAWRYEALTAITVAPFTRVQLLTKRVGNVERMVPPTWISNGWPTWVGLMITVVNQEEANRDVPKLLHLKKKLGIPWVGLSVEPMLAPVNISPFLANGWDGDIRKAVPAPRLDWVICGGESGPNARPMHPRWAAELASQCESAGVPFLFKQWGEYLHEAIYNPLAGPKPSIVVDGERYMKVGKKKAGRYLHPWGEMNGFPEALT